MSVEVIAWLGWTAVFALGALYLHQRAELLRERHMRKFWEANFTRMQSGEMPQPKPDPSF